ncbi:hypothetical protein [Flavobacterium sp.]|uniref:hypothetical protein n=1 Tax=Flavobacterium sp. TaxID=239 RepID=UPI003D132E6C
MNQSYNKEKKSLAERFLLVLSILLFTVYLIMGLAILFWDKLIERMPMAVGYRVTLGVAIIVYGFFRFIRYFNKSR